uniref:Probable magnesium transporter n=1 Tax=Nelumbo nucifera TaxID=4432 RepID=A0A822XUA3_NELNU|nr:TPA_asm: hypothetical protein HUJ06_023858 [Nelumbo nucifera]
MFTTLTIIASAIMFKDWSGQNLSSITSEVCGFITVLSGTIIFHTTREQEAYPHVWKEKSNIMFVAMDL